MAVDVSGPPGAQRVQTPEKPLSGSARTALLVSCALVAVLYYLFAAFAVTVTALLIAFDTVVLVVAVRFGLAGKLVPPIRAVCSVLATLVGSLKLESEAEFHFSVPRGVAPGLYDLVADVARRVGVTPPSNIVLEMTNNASVLLRGYGTGRGDARLSIGFDTLAILSEREIEGLVAHELAHAKLVMRGFRKVVLSGVGRCWQTAAGLSSIRGSAAHANQRFLLAEALDWMATPLAKLACRLAAAYSRQDEFEADRLAAEICGPAACRSAMQSTVLASVKGSDLSFRERLMHLERDESFTDWLHSRLTPASEEEQAELEAKAAKHDERDEFDTHPSFSHRMAMWAADSAPRPASLPAIGLIRDPDYVARKLADEIEQIIVKQEQESTDRLQRWVRKRSVTHARLTAAQAAIVIAGFLTLVFAVLFLAAGMVTELVVAVAALVALVMAFPRVGFKERFPLPFPGYGAWREKQNEKREPSDADDKELEAVLVASVPGPAQGAGRAALYWAERAYAALAQCDYKTAAVASRLALKSNPRCPEALLANAIAEAYFGNQDAAHRSIDSIYQRYSLGGTMTWGFGWALFLLDNHDASEVYLLDAALRHPTEPSLLAVLGRCQWERGRLSEALRNFRQALGLRPDDFALRFSYARLLLDMRRAKAVGEHIQRLEREKPGDFEVMSLGCSAAMLLGHEDEAARRRDELLERHPGSKALGMLGALCADAEEEDKARDYFLAVRECGFSPSALLSLAGYEYRRDNKEATRDLLLEALDMCKEPLEDSFTVLQALPPILSGLASCNEEAEGCSAWSATIDLADTPGKLARMSFLVCAPTLDYAKAYLSGIHAAMYPGAALDPDKVRWEPQPGEKPPEKISPGVYGFIPETR